MTRTKTKKPLVVITTFDREKSFWECFNSIDRKKVDIFIVQDSKSEHHYTDDFYKLNERYPSVSMNIKLRNVGVGTCKADGIEYAKENGYEHLFLVEDDVIVTDNSIWKHFMDFSKHSGVKHTNWNGVATNPVKFTFNVNDKIKGEVRNEVHGSFQYFETSVFDEVRMDTDYINAYEHVDLEYQLYQKGLIPPFWFFVSPENCGDYLKCEPPNGSVIIQHPKHKENLDLSIKVWIDKWGFKPVQVPATSRSEFDLKRILLQSKYGIVQKKRKPDKPNPVSIICTIKDRSHFRYTDNSQLLPSELQMCNNHDKVIASVWGVNKDRGGVLPNQIHLSSSEGFRPFEQFLKSVNEQAHTFKGDVELVVVDWSSTDVPVEDTLSAYWDHDVKIVTLNHDEVFSRGFGLDSGIKASKYDSLHLTDVDMVYHTPKFLEDASRLSDEALFPTIYKEQTPSGLTLYLEIAGFGIASFSKEDYLKTRGFIDKRSWGAEDTELALEFEKLLGPSKIRRDVYSGVIHKWHSSK